MKKILTLLFFIISILTFGQAESEESTTPIKLRVQKIRFCNSQSYTNFHSTEFNLDINSGSRLLRMREENILLAGSSCGNKSKPLNYKLWLRMYMMKLGIGFGSSLITDSGFTKRNYGFNYNLDLGDFSVGFRKLGGIGIGTKVVTLIGIPKIQIISYVPIYLYLPIYTSVKDDETNIKTSVNLYAGGSLWCSENLGLLSNDGIHADKYYHFGANYMFYNYAGKSLYETINFSLDAGLLLYQYKDSNIKNGFYISLMTNIAGASRIVAKR